MKSHPHKNYGEKSPIRPFLPSLRRPFLVHEAIIAKKFYAFLRKIIALLRVKIVTRMYERITTQNISPKKIWEVKLFSITFAATNKNVHVQISFPLGAARKNRNNCTDTIPRHATWRSKSAKATSPIQSANLLSTRRGSQKAARFC